MFARVTVKASDATSSQRFYASVFPDQAGELTIVAAGGEPTRHLHLALSAPSHDDVDAFHARGAAAGYTSDGAPGPRPQYRPDYYGAFLLDPDGNSVEAVHHTSARPAWTIDHMWVRVSGVDAHETFHAALAEHTGARLIRHAPGHLQVKHPSGGTFSLVTADSAWPQTTDFEIALTGGAGIQWRDPDGRVWAAGA